MGMFDYVNGPPCAACGSTIEYQSKSGPCSLSTLEVEDLAPGDNYYGWCDNPDCSAGYLVMTVPPSAKDGYRDGYRDGWADAMESLEKG